MGYFERTEIPSLRQTFTASGIIIMSEANRRLLPSSPSPREGLGWGNVGAQVSPTKKARQFRRAFGRRDREYCPYLIPSHFYGQKLIVDACSGVFG